MDFCSPEGFDAFLSYARADDEANNGWVADFHWYLRRFVTAQLHQDEAVRNEDAARLDICFDKACFPQSGPLAEAIEDYVLRSEFLFIFLGRGYLRSQYCLADSRRSARRSAAPSTRRCDAPTSSSSTRTPSGACTGRRPSPCRVNAWRCGSGCRTSRTAASARKTCSTMTCRCR
jgi:hypothetical protein